MCLILNNEVVIDKAYCLLENRLFRVYVVGRSPFSFSKSKGSCLLYYVLPIVETAETDLKVLEQYSTNSGHISESAPFHVYDWCEKVIAFVEARKISTMTPLSI